MVITPDGSTLVISESFAGRLSAFDIQEDGSLTAAGRGRRASALRDRDRLRGRDLDPDRRHVRPLRRPGAPAGAVVRVLEGGEITHRVETPLPCFAWPWARSGRQLLLLCNELEGVDKPAEVQARRSAQVLVTEAPYPA